MTLFIAYSIFSAVQCPVRPGQFVSPLCFAAFAGGSLAQTDLDSVPADKRQFTLLNPTPRALLRDLSTDRPDKTESAYTVDAGHFQLEMDLGSYTGDRHNSDPGEVHLEALSLASLNFKVGLLNDLDVQVMIPVYNRVRLRDRANREVGQEEGFDDLAVRTKFNVWGNDEGATALAFMPFVSLPAGARLLGSRSVEGGVIVPSAVEIPLNWSMGLMSELVDAKHSDRRWSEHRVTRSADDFNPFLGLAFRF